MKYFMQLAMAALLLFSISAALSLWLNQSKQAANEKESGEKNPKKGGKEADAGHDTPAGDSHPVAKHDSPAGTQTDLATSVLRQEERLERRKAQMDLVLRDLQAEGEAVDALVRQVTAETKNVAGRAAEVEAKAATTAKLPAGLDPIAERKNIKQLAETYNAMAPESAATIMKQSADSGKLDTVVAILAEMKDRQTAQVLAEIAKTEATLAATITDRIRGLRRTPTTGGGPTVLPAAAPPPSPIRSP